MEHTYHFHRLPDVLDLYEEVCGWMDEHGIDYKSTRFGFYRKVFDRIERISKLKLDVDIYDIKDSFENAYIEIHRIARIYNSISKLDSTQFISQLKKIASGQEFSAQSDHDPARDFAFELSVAARFIKAGYKVSIDGIADVEVDLDNRYKLFVECKRIKSYSKIRHNSRKALRQIGKRIPSKPGMKYRGMIALNLTDLIPRIPGVVSSPHAATARHRFAVNRFIEDHFESIYQVGSNKMLGVMCVSEMMFHEDNKGEPSLMYSRHTVFLPSGTDPDFERLSGEISNHDIS